MWRSYFFDFPTDAPVQDQNYRAANDCHDTPRHISEKINVLCAGGMQVRGQNTVLNLEGGTWLCLLLPPAVICTGGASARILATTPYTLRLSELDPAALQVCAEIMFCWSWPVYARLS